MDRDPDGGLYERNPFDYAHRHFSSQILEDVDDVLLNLEAYLKSVLDQDSVYIQICSKERGGADEQPERVAKPKAEESSVF